MTDEYKKSATPNATGTGTGTGTGTSKSTHPRHEAWQPRVQKDEPFNAFESDHRSPDSLPPSSTIRDARKDTAPLQGEKDLSDSDSLSNEYSPNQDGPTTTGESPRNDRNTQS